jgi:hypothetical protein
MAPLPANPAVSKSQRSDTPPRSIPWERSEVTRAGLWPRPVMSSNWKGSVRPQQHDEALARPQSPSAGSRWDRWRAAAWATSGGWLGHSSLTPPRANLCSATSTDETAGEMHPGEIICARGTAHDACRWREVLVVCASREDSVLPAIAG